MKTKEQLFKEIDILHDKIIKIDNKIEELKESRKILTKKYLQYIRESKQFLNNK
jgi:uncharacterized coiled-coil DUF342 family protein